MKRLSTKARWRRVNDFLIAGGRLVYGDTGEETQRPMKLPSRYAVVNCARALMGDILMDEAMRLVDELEEEDAE